MNFTRREAPEVFVVRLTQRFYIPMAACPSARPGCRRAISSLPPARTGLTPYYMYEGEYIIVHPIK